MIDALGALWFTFLYQPLFNALIWIYTFVANQNLGWAVVWLTLFLRVALLPLNLIAARNSMRRQKAVQEASNAIKAFKNDPVAQKEATRKIVKKYRMSPWASALMLGIQLLVLILLYQVFIRGITGEKVVKILYSSIDYPGKINTNFYGFEIGKIHDSLWSAIAAGALLASILMEYALQKTKEKADLFYMFMFPLFTFVVLWYLPMVKSLFILTTIVFSDILTLIRHLFMAAKQHKPHEANASHH